MTAKAKRILLILAGVILLVFLLLKITTAVVSKKLPEILNQEVKDYSIDFKEVDVSLFSEYVFVKGISIKPLNKEKTSINAEIEAFELQGVDFYQLIFNNKLLLNSLSIEEANTKVFIVKEKQESAEKPLKKFLKEVFVRVKLNSININNSSLSYYLENDTIPKIHVEEFSLSFNEIVLDTSTIRKVFPFSVSSLNGTITKATFKTDSLYHLKFSKLEISRQSIFVDSLSYTTDLTKAQFQKKMPIQKDWIYFMAPKLELLNYKWETDSSDFYLAIQKACVQNMELVAYRDKNLPFGPETKKPMPSEMLRNIPFNLQIDSVQVKRGSIQYLEKQEGKTEKGQVDFDKVYATIYNITNDSVKLANNPWMTLDAQCTFNHCGHLQTHWEFNIPDLKDHFKINGQLDKMELVCVNQTFKPMLDVEVKGTVQQVKFNYTGDVAQSKGEVFFDYEGLQVQFYDENKEVKNWLKNTVGNAAIRSNNLPSNASYKKGVFEFERVQHKSIFNYLWKSVQTGLMPIVLPFKGEKVDK